MQLQDDGVAVLGGGGDAGGVLSGRVRVRVVVAPSAYRTVMVRPVATWASVRSRVPSCPVRSRSARRCWAGSSSSLDIDLVGRLELPPDVERIGLTTAPTSTGGRTLTDGTAGARLHPYADLQPAGTRSADLRRLGHRSPGSAG